MNTNAKKNIISIFLTIAVISLLIFSGPARAIDVSLTTPDINVFSKDGNGNPTKYTFTISVTINDGEFLPIQYTDLIFNDGDNKLTCRIQDDKSDCDFITSVQTDVSNLNYKQDYGYGYGYGNGYGYQNFGYGYGYGAIPNQGSGFITYTLIIDQSKLPGTFVDQSVEVEARVYGGTDDNQANFRGPSNFEVTAPETPVTVTDKRVENTINLGSSEIKIPANALPAGATGIKVQQIAKNAVAAPTTVTLKVLSKIFEFQIDGGTTNVFNEPVTLTITYTDEELALAGITDESKISPYFFDVASNDWTNAGITEIVRDPANNKIEFKVSHFTKFTLLADTSTTTTSTPSSSTTTNAGGAGGTRVGVTPAETTTEETPVTPTEVAPTETVTPTTGGLAGITGAVIGAAKNNSTVLIVIVSVVLVILILTRVSIKNPFGKGKGKKYQPSARYE